MTHCLFHLQLLIYQVVKPRPASTLLHRTFGEDRVMPVYFNEFPTEDKFQLVRDGIMVGLRRYRFWSKWCINRLINCLASLANSIQEVGVNIFSVHR